MDIKPDTPEHKPERDRMANRHRNGTFGIKHNGADITVTAGYYADGRIGEIFITAGHANSALDVLASDAAIMASIALQFGAPLDVLRHAVKRNSQGEPSSPIGAALDRIAP